MAITTGGRAARFSSGAGRPSIAQDLISRGLSAEQELYGGQAPTTPALPEDMQVISGVTQDVMNQWKSIEDFAQQMWANYRINVTRPDVRNPLAVKAHDLYQQSIAGLQYAGDVMKQSNTLLSKDRDAVREGRGMILQDPTQNIYGMGTPEDSRFVNTEYDPLAMASNQAYAKSYDTRSATKAAQGQVDVNQQQAAQRLEEMGAPNRAELVRQQFQGPVYEQPQFNPNTGQRQNQDPKPIYDQLTNYRIGILNNDPGVLGEMKSVLGLLDIRPVNTSNKKGAYITEKIDDRIVTSFLDLGAGNPTQGYQNLLYKINSINPNKFKVDVNAFTPYLQSVGVSNETESQGSPETEEFATIFQSFTKPSVKLGNGKQVNINDDDRENFINKLDKLAIANKLRMDDGRPIINVEMTDKDGIGTGDLLQIDIAGQDEPILLDPESPEDMQMFRNIMDINSSYLVSPESWKKGATPYINSDKMNPGEAGRGQQIDVDKKAQARSLLEMFEAKKKAQK